MRVPSWSSAPYKQMYAWMVLCIIACTVVMGCGHRSTEPTIEFTRVPPASEGGPDKLENIEGLVRGAYQGKRLVLYAKAGSVWWIQPLATKPFTSIASNGVWNTSTHLGTEYGAILVDSAYVPASTLKNLPPLGSGVTSVASKSVGPGPVMPTRTLKFSGYDWSVRHITSDRNGAISYYEPSNAWTDNDGALHLRISRDGDRWKCSQVVSANHFGYGTYLFTVQNSAQFEPAAALVMFTYDELAAEHHREMDIEMSRWGDPQSKNADYVVQPYMFPENKVIFETALGRLTHSLKWEPGRAEFATYRGVSTNTVPLKKSDFTNGIPAPGGEAAVIDFCDFKYAKVPLQNGQEVVIERFQYLP